ncbi:MAG: hypothetical protein NVSMB22_07330 [Chloroflexota bacterium]
MTGIFWLSYALRSLRRGGRRSLFALVCVAVGVAGVVALQTASLTVQDALTSNVRAANGGDISLTSQTAPLASSDLALFKRLQRQGRIAQWTAVASVHATAVGFKRALVPFDVNVVQAPPYPVGGQPTFVSPSNGRVGSLLAHPGDVLVTSVLAEELGAHIGDRLLVNGLGGVGLHAVVRGITAETSFEHSAIMTVQRRDAAALTSRTLTYSAVLINVSGAAQATPVARILRNAFPVATVSTVQDALAAAQLQVHDFRQFLLLVALFALLIAGIGILNAMQSILAWRRLEIAMLKAIGFGRGTLYALFGGEALILGLIGGVVGTALGALGSKTISDALARAVALQITFRLDTSILLGGVALGAVSTLVFAILPIVRASGFRPLEILREGTTGTVESGLQTVGLLALVLLLFAALASTIVGDTQVAVEFVVSAFVVCAVLTGLFSLMVGWINNLGRPRTPAIGVVVFGVLSAVAVLAVIKIPAVSAIVVLAACVWLVTMVVPQSWLLSLVIAARSLGRRRARTSVTLVAFLAGVLAMTVTMTVALSLQNQINGALARAGKTNLVVVSNPTDERTVLRAASALPGIQDRATTSFATTKATALRGQTLAVALGPAPPGSPGDENDRGRLFDGITGYQLRQGNGPQGLQIVGGRPLRSGDAGTGNVLVRGTLREAPFLLRVGDTLTLKGTASGISRTVQVVGFYNRPRGSRGFGSFFVAPILGDSALATTLGGADAQSIASFVVDKARLTHDAAAIQRAVPGALVIDIGDLTAVVETILNELLNLLAVITALVLGAGTAVVANGVTLAMFERRREIALYKAVGFGPGSVLRFVLVENALIGTVAGATSVLGTAIALGVLSRVALQQSIGFDPLVAVYVLFVATALAVVTAYIAARTPIRVRPLEALRNE